LKTNEKFFTKIGVGKSSMLLRFVANEFKPTFESTLGAAFLSKTINYNETPVKFQVISTLIHYL